MASNAEPVPNSTPESNLESSTGDSSTKDVPQDKQAHQLWRTQLLRLNLLAWKTPPGEGANLDSNIKKNTSFIKKCRVSLNAINAPTMIKEINQLKLEKYLSEVVAALSEGILKCRNSSNIMAAVEVISALHQRFPETFTPELFETIRRMLSPPSRATANNNSLDRDEASRLLRLRITLRITTELWLVGFFWGIENGLSTHRSTAEPYLDSLLKETQPPIETLPPLPSSLKTNRLGLIYHSIKDLLPCDKDKFANAALAVSFLKSFGDDLSGAALPPHPSVVTEEHREVFHALFHNYAEELIQSLVKDHKSLQREERVNQERYIARGEIHEDTRARFEAHFKSYEKHLQFVQSITECLGITMPDLPKDDGGSSMGNIVVNDSNGGLTNDETNFENGPWEDDDARIFYEKILDLKTLVPAMLLGSTQPTLAEPVEGLSNEEDLLKEESANGNIEETEEVGDELDQEVEEAEETVEDDAPLSVSAQTTLFLTKLPNMGNRDLVDQAAVDFCYVSNKASIKRLTQSLIQVPITRLDLLSHYARFMATLNPYFPTINQIVELALAKEFRTLMRRKTSTPVQSALLEKRIRNARYLGELTKFKLTPEYFTFFILKTLLDNFASPGNAETLCAYLEVCGRFLAKSPNTAARTAGMLEIMMRKKNALHLGDRITMGIENAFYMCHPPVVSAIVKRERSMMEQFIRNLLLVQLPNRPPEKILRLLRKLNWAEETEEGQVTRRTLHSLFSKVHKSKFAHLPGLASLLGGLTRYHPDFVMRVVDQVFEDIRVGLETNHFKDNQKRIAQSKYIAEFYNYRVLEAPVIFDTLYLILTLGYPQGKPDPNSRNPMDIQDDYFRVRLCCTILDACGVCFDRGHNRTRLDEFLTFFQLYLLTKTNPLPLDVQFAINDTLELIRPDWVLVQEYDVAVAAMNKISQAKAPQSNGNTNGEPVKEEDDDDQDDDDDVSNSSGSSSDNNEEDVEEEEVEEEEEEIIMDDADDDKIVLLNQHKTEEDLAQRQLEEEEFEREYQLMMASTLESRRLERKAAPLDVPIPIKLMDKQPPQPFESDEGTKVAFTLLTKRGNKQQMKKMALPADSSLVINTLNKQRIERAEQQQLKKIVLSLEENLDMEAQKEFELELMKQGVKVVPNKSSSASASTNNSSSNTGTANQRRPNHYHGGGESNTIKASDFGLRSRGDHPPFKQNNYYSRSGHPTPRHHYAQHNTHENSSLDSNQDSLNSQEQFPPLSANSQHQVQTSNNSNGSHRGGNRGKSYQYRPPV